MIKKKVESQANELMIRR